MDILRDLWRLESKLARTVDEAAQKMTRSSVREPLEIVHAILVVAEKRIEPAGRGKYVFPFNQINVCIAANSAETRARFEAVFKSEPTLHERIVERLQAAGCELTNLSVNTDYVDSAESHWTSAEFNVEFDRFDGRPQPAPHSIVADQNLILTIVNGAAERRDYVFTIARVNLGRCAEVRDNRNRLIRTNHVAFAESAEGPNLSVSRQHAHIECAITPREYRLCDDRSAQGTSVMRDGKTITVPPGPRGIRLQSGDVITLGEARLQVEIEFADSAEAKNRS